MICPLYEALTPLERVEMIGKIAHAAQSDNATFVQVQALIALAERKGLFENVIINPTGNDNTNYEQRK